MNTVQVTLSIYYKIMDADLYGGVGSTGYSKIDIDYDLSDLAKVDIQSLGETCAWEFAKICKVPTENVVCISRTEYEANTADLEGPDIVTEF